MRRVNLGLWVLLVTACAGSDTETPSAEHEIVGGRTATALAAVGYLSMDSDLSGRMFERFCTATLVAPRVVVTAAHCVHEMKYAQRPEGPWMTFATGAATSFARRPTRVYSVYEAPRYNPDDPAYQINNGSQHDFAVLVLANDVVGVTPARVASLDVRREHLAIGYGRTIAGAFDLLEQGLPKRKSIPMSILAEGTSPTFVRAAPANRRTDSVCYGDSGGPLLEIDSSRPEEAVLVGVLASMQNDDPTRTCLPGTPAGYSSPTAHQSLIGQALRSAVNGPP
jgi:secreted trypsin-like serine protease